MQIQYYQNHYKQYLGDAFTHLRDREKMNPESSSKKLGRSESKVEEEASVQAPPPELLTQLVSASTTSSSLFVSFKEFYVREFDFIDLYREYVRWLKIGDSPIGYVLTFLVTKLAIIYHDF